MPCRCTKQVHRRNMYRFTLRGFSPRRPSAAEEDDATGIWKTDSFTRLATNHSQTQRSRPPGTQTSGGGGPLRCPVVFFE